MIHYGDIKEIKGSNVPIVDVVTGGSPCQDLSVAGNREGLSGERSGLFMEQIRVIKEMREHDRANRGTDVDIRLLRPRYMVWENVQGALSSGKPKGEDFRIVLEETAKIADKDAVIPECPKGGWTPSGCILGDGWSVAWRIHDAQFWGVPQRRKRIALVADFGGSSAPEILFERKSVSRDTESSEQTGEEIAGDIGNGTKESDITAYTLKVRGGAEFDRHGKRAGKGALIQTELNGDIAGTLDASCYKGTGMRRDRERTVVLDKTLCIGNGQANDAVHIEEEVRKTLNHLVDPMKILQIQSSEPNEESKAKCIGIDCYNQSVSEEVSMPLRSKSADSDHIPCVAYGVDCYNQSVTGDVAKTLTSGRNDKNNIPCVSTVHGEPAVCYGLDRASFNQGQNAKYGFSIEEELSPTIVAKGPGGVLTKP